MSYVHAIKQRLRDLPIRHKLGLLLAMLVVNLLLVIGLSVLGMSTLSQVRAYVGGEGLWAKNQKNAVFSLTRYALSGQEKDYQDYRRFLAAPLGDRKARMELSKASPDLRLSDQGFLEGRNHPEDVRGMAVLFLRFHGFEPIATAIRIWGHADTTLQELQDRGEAFHALAQRGTPSRAQTAAFISQLEALNDRLTADEDEFSATLGQAARWAQRLILWAIVLGSLGCTLLGVLAASHFSRSIVRGVTLLSAAASRAAGGDLRARIHLGSSDELGRLAEAFNTMAEGLTNIDRLKNSFVSNVSHELRTPLTLNLAPMESLLAGDYGRLASDQERVLRVMHNNTLRLLQLVNGLLDFSKLKEGKMMVDRQPTDITRLSASIVDDFGPLLRKHGLRTTLRLNVGQPLVLMDRYVYERILFNLVSNAIKFTPNGGHIEVALAQAKDRLTLKVIDTGIGISEAESKELFQKFHQAEASSTRRYEGTGLGLALVRECAQVLEGSVSLASRLGQGSTFTVELGAPLAPPGLAPDAGSERRRQPRTPVIGATSPEPVPEASPALPKVLVVEDNPEMSDFVVRLLSSNCQLRCCGDGEAALAVANAWGPDLILSNVMMPKMDGLSLVRALKAAPATAAIPVVLLTALTSQEDLLRGWDAGADDYLFKPFHPRELQTRVRSLLSMVAWRQRSQQQQKRQEILELFTRIASHDLKSPLRRMSSYASLLLQDYSGSLADEGLEYLRAIARSASQMNLLVENLIKFSKLDASESGYKDCDLGQLVEDCVRFFEPAITELAAKVEVGPMPTLEAVPEQMAALFQNLLGNSIKYQDPTRPLRVSIKAEQAGPAWHFQVNDNGLGFNPAHRDDVFVLFKRLVEEGSVPGEGMGLAIAKKIVDIHGGRIWAESSPGQGCTIHFTLLGQHAR